MLLPCIALFRETALGRVSLVHGLGSSLVGGEWYFGGFILFVGFPHLGFQYAIAVL